MLEKSHFIFHRGEARELQIWVAQQISRTLNFWSLVASPPWKMESRTHRLFCRKFNSEQILFKTFWKGSVPFFLGTSKSIFVPEKQLLISLPKRSGIVGKWTIPSQHASPGKIVACTKISNTQRDESLALRYCVSECCILQKFIFYEDS